MTQFVCDLSPDRIELVRARDGQVYSQVEWIAWYGNIEGWTAGLVTQERNWALLVRTMLERQDSSRPSPARRQSQPAQ